MSTAEAIHICDSQYNPSQVHSTFNIVVSNTQEATARTVPATAAEILHRYMRYSVPSLALRELKCVGVFDVPLTIGFERGGG